jgi:hypothetical protein
MAKPYFLRILTLVAHDKEHTLTLLTFQCVLFSRNEEIPVAN